jgi:polyisoprenoid-binding protein YceI
LPAVQSFVWQCKLLLIMKRLLIILLFIISGSYLYAQTYIATDAGSEAMFSIKNFGLTVTGSFKGLQGKIIFDPANLPAASFNVSVDAGTVNTGNSSRDKHLKKDDYFDITNYPKLHFNSAKITQNAGAYIITGQLTIKGVTKQISFPFTAKQEGSGYRFAGQFSISRRNFTVGGSSWVLSDNLTVSLNVSAIK